MAIADRATNADLIADCFDLGYLRDEWLILDPTYGHGVFWKKRRPLNLVASDIDPAKCPWSEHRHGVDFTRLPWAARTFAAVVFDPPYKLNGRPTEAVDGRYGVGERRSRDQRHGLILNGLEECERVLATNGYLLVKCQDQVEAGKVRWQTDIVTRKCEDMGLRKVDALLMPSYRPQPDGRSQQHARRNYSTLLVFVKGARPEVVGPAAPPERGAEA